jgi:indolepyruvate ferredoxin oxidoreductase
MAFANGHNELLIVEEKRPVIEDQFAKLLINVEQRPRLVGKTDQHGQPLISAEGELAPAAVALVIGKRLLASLENEQHSDKTELVKKLAQRVDALAQILNQGAVTVAALTRLPSFCAGCPHNTSTNLPEGSVAFGGIGCHGMATFLPERRTPTLFQMGGEGASWIGIAPFSDTPHIFQNLGDGTYYHSGLLAIRAAVAAGVNITYKILVNDAIAMTGGQQIEGQMRVDELSRQIHAEGVRRIAVVTNNPTQYGSAANFAPDVTIHHRDDLDAVQTELRAIAGTTAIIYDQHCATELRRRRKRGSVPDPDQRTFINQRVCEGCGDCSVQSNCIAIEPVETDFGRKRRINQSACNKDFSCLKGYCPSFVTLRGAKPRKRGSAAATNGANNFAQRVAALPIPQPVDTAIPYSVLLTGIGGSGVVTLGALLGVAAHLEGKGCSVLDVAGLAQRNGPVTSHIRIAATPEQLHATRIAAADLIIGSDIVVTAGRDVLGKIYQHKTRAVVNNHVAPTSAFASNPDLDLSAQKMQDLINAAAGSGAVEFIAATELAYALLGNEVAANLFLVGYALQRGWLPIGLAALERAIELNGVAVEMNKASLAWGRLAAHDLAAVQQSAGLAQVVAIQPAQITIADIVARNSTELTAFQNDAYAQRYRTLVERVAAVEKKIAGSASELTRAVAQYYYKLLAYKDEYEVARLYSAPEFMQRLREEFEGDFSIEFNMAPPLLQSRDARTGRYKKRTFGPWMLTAFKWLAKMKVLRGTPFDLFGYSHHRRAERQLIEDYEATINEITTKLTSDNLDIAAEIAALPEFIRGYDIVKERHMQQAQTRREKLLAQFRNGKAAQKISIAELA